MNKRNVEYTYEAPPAMRGIATWLEEMAEDRWELVCSHKNAFIFRRPIISEYSKRLQDTIKNHQISSSDSQYYRGVIAGLKAANSMYNE